MRRESLFTDGTSRATAATFEDSNVMLIALPVPVTLPMKVRVPRLSTVAVTDNAPEAALYE